MTTPSHLRHWITLCEGEFDRQPMIRVYHAQSHVIPAALKNRQVANYNSMGTWFTNSRDMVTIYGKNITPYDIPAEGYLEVGQDGMETSVIGMNVPLIADHFGQATADHMEQFPWTAETRGELANLERWRKEARIEPKRVREPKIARLKALEKSREITRQALNSAAYCADFRSMIEGDIHDHGFGHRGLVWHNVKFDGWHGAPADIYLLFHREDIQPAAG